MSIAACKPLARPGIRAIAMLLFLAPLRQVPPGPDAVHSLTRKGNEFRSFANLDQLITSANSPLSQGDPAPAFARALRSRPLAPMLRAVVLGPGPSLVSPFLDLFGCRSPERLGFAVPRVAQPPATSPCEDTGTANSCCTLPSGSRPSFILPDPAPDPLRLPTQLRASRDDSRLDDLSPRLLVRSERVRFPPFAVGRGVSRMTRRKGLHTNHGRFPMINVTLLHSVGASNQTSDQGLARLGTFAVAVAGLMALLALAL